MTVGTTTNLDETRLTIISDAMMLLGVNAAGEAIADADMQLGVRWLNRLIKQWQGLGIHVWTNSYATLYFELGVQTYYLGNETQGGVHWAEEPVEQSLTADAAAAATTLNIDSSLLLTVGDHIGIIDNDGDIQWTTVATKPSSTSVTISTPLLVASDSGNYVYSYTERPASGSPLRILQANLKSGLGEQVSSIIMPALSFSDFFQLTSKLSPGTPINWSYQRNINSGDLMVWPTPNVLTNRMVLHYTRPMFDFDTAVTTQDLGQEWITAIIYNLAVLLAPSYGKSNLLQTLTPLASEFLGLADSYDQEDVSLYLSPTKYRY